MKAFFFLTFDVQMLGKTLWLGKLTLDIRIINYLLVFLLSFLSVWIRIHRSTCIPLAFMSLSALLI